MSVTSLWRNLVVLGANSTSVIKEIRLKIWPLASRLSRSLKVVGIDIDRSATYDFLLTFRSNQWPISYCFWDKQHSNFSRKSQFFPTPCILWPNWRGFPWNSNWVPALGVKKTRMIRLLGRERSLTIFSAVRI